MTDIDERNNLLGYLERQLIGPHGVADEVLDEAPHRRYLTGILFPSQSEEDFAASNEVEDDERGAVGDDNVDDPIALSGQRLPSSAGMSFVLGAWAPINVGLAAGRYVEESKDRWKRSSIGVDEALRVVILPPDEPGWTKTKIDDGSLTVDVLWRKFAGGALVTVALVNRRLTDTDAPVDAADCLFQVSLSCESSEGRIVPYPTHASLQTDAEEEELELLYRAVPTFAIGHGVAASWEADTDASATVVHTSFLPQHSVPGVRFDLDGGEEILGLGLLENVARDRVIQLLDEFVGGYADWLDRLRDRAVHLDSRFTSASGRIIERVDTIILRMRRGVRLLEHDDQVRLAFALANEAMLDQMLRTRHGTSEVRRSRNDEVPDLSGVDRREASWRPFQLAFLLLTIEGVADPTSDDRQIVDLIWFPTGGGKTEAYLGLMAFTIFLRRLRSGDDGAGTTVITRYTLRLLTAQQFQRTAILTCAMELIRRSREEQLGTIPVSIGLWVGGGTSPNKYADAVELLETLREGEYTSKGFQLDSCPWCGTEIIPSDKDADGFGVLATNDSFSMRCPNSRCEFHGRLAVSTVDDDLFKNPPTVLVGTVDKFARFAWDSRPGSFLGTGLTPGPSLIVQDEFHLISGPLGTIMGVYEAAFDVVMRRKGAAPKIVSSTATIRRSADQAQGVFGREVSLFPPSGIDADDSYFVRSDHTVKGRLYVGAMSQGHTPLTATVHVSAAMLQASGEVPFEAAAADSYWTLVAYHNSLRELGKTVTLAHDDIPMRMNVIAEVDDEVRPLPNDEVMELTSNVPASEIPGRLRRLTMRKNSGEAVSLLACTNMLSVGVDVPRLGLMLMVGQPKTTAEYIQASSRVGRSTPGLVLTLYSPAKPRDRSHFETFVPYHSALYRAVEPTSVTPFSIPSRDRALHAAMVILARHGAGWSDDDDAASFDSTDSTWLELRQALVSRIQLADSSESHRAEKQIALLESQWMASRSAGASSGGLKYRNSGRQKESLLKRFNTRGPGWATLDSMRNVDVGVDLVVRGEQNG